MTTTVQTTDPVALAIAAAQQAAAARVEATSAVVAAPAGSSAVSTHVGKAQALTMETIMSGSLSVDGWIKPKEFGLLIGDSADLFQSCKVTLDMTDGRGFVVKRGVKGGNPAQYAYTTDGVTCVSGGSWADAVQKMKALDPKCTGEYRCVDLPFTLLESVVVNGKLQMEAGKKLGYTTSTTNWKNWEEFYRDVSQAGLLGRVVELEITCERRENKHGNKWGVLKFKLLGEHLTDEAE